MDAKTALQGDLNEEIYMIQANGFVDTDKPDHVCKLNKGIYGLKQAATILAKIMWTVSFISYCRATFS